MTLTDELYEKLKLKKEKFTAIDAKTVALVKKMPVTDEKLNDYINSIKNAYENGINIMPIIDYRLIPGTTTYFSEGNFFTTGVFLEKKAPGKENMSNMTYTLKTDSFKNITEGIQEYFQLLESYIAFLEEKAAYPTEFYIKLVSDYQNIEKYGLTVDPKPSNVFASAQDGFTIIDPIPLTPYNGIKEEFLARFISLAVLGFGRPALYIPGTFNKSFLPENLSIRYQKAVVMILNNICAALIQFEVKDEYIESLKRITVADFSNYLVMDSEMAYLYIESLLKDELKSSEMKRFS